MQTIFGEINEQQPILNLTGVELIARERKEQIEKHGFNSQSDANYTRNELNDAAVFCITMDDFFYPKTWSLSWRHEVIMKEYSERLAIAGALIAAEIDRHNNTKFHQ